MAEEEGALVQGNLLAGKRGVVMGVANKDSIAWGIARVLASQGAQMAFTIMEAMEKRVRPLAGSIGVQTLIPCEVTDDASMDTAFRRGRGDVWDHRLPGPTPLPSPTRTS